MPKTNKSFAKRLRVTRSGKVLVRIPGKNHFNAKTRRVKQLHQKGLADFVIPRKTLKRFLPFEKN
ncbi:50S ribosomal protein L35 [Candidatus Giovannonibacteria bacterium]|nr:50S ribosomal protein L35 [Candidatus Giovannonibacteria bacterium]